MAVIELYEEAFLEEDCDLFVQATALAFRERIGLTECATFIDYARGRAQVVDSLELTPVSVDGTGRGTMAALVDVRLGSLVDGSGTRVTSPVELEYEYRYHFVRANGGWKIEDVHDVTGGRTEGQPTAEEEQAAARTIADWRVAYSSGDCDAAVASTTVAYRESMGWTDCPSFAQYISDQNEYCPMDVHQEDIRFHSRIDPHVGEIILDVVEVCTLSVDEFGVPIEPPYEVGSPYRYHLVEGDDGWKIAEGDNGAEAEDEPGNTNERAAIEAIRGYNQAWMEGDCETYMATTAEAYRTLIDLSGCAAFGPASRGYAAGVANFAITPTDIERPSAKSMEIKTHETYDNLTDDEGQPVDPFLVDEYWVYSLVLVDGSWVISDVVMLL